MKSWWKVLKWMKFGVNGWKVDKKAWNECKNRCNYGSHTEYDNWCSTGSTTPNRLFIHAGLMPGVTLLLTKWSPKYEVENQHLWKISSIETLPFIQSDMGLDGRYPFSSSGSRGVWRRSSISQFFWCISESVGGHASKSGTITSNSINTVLYMCCRIGVAFDFS